ncbi:MAG TPA: lysophospholipid acyltransferase family protein [Terriglobales bacterium]|nr:lysophospholipid acyltransferase family protein [Terriglobales bacterium]
MREALLLGLAPRLLSAALRLLSWTLRLEYRGTEELLQRWQRGEPSLLSCWHNRVLIMPLACQLKPRSAQRGDRGIAILVSASRDGEIASRALNGWGIAAVRGSAARGGAAGFLQLLRAHRRGYDLALIPDGSRGPRYVAKAGAVHLARATGAPLWPVSYAASRFLQLRSWDRLIIPLPFARVVLVAGDPMQVTRDSDDAALELARLELERRLNQVTAAAEDAVGRHSR